MHWLNFTWCTSVWQKNLNFTSQWAASHLPNYLEHFRCLSSFGKAFLHERLRAAHVARLPAVPRVDRAGAHAADVWCGELSWFDLNFVLTFAKWQNVLRFLQWLCNQIVMTFEKRRVLLRLIMLRCANSHQCDEFGGRLRMVRWSLLSAPIGPRAERSKLEVCDRMGLQ